MASQPWMFHASTLAQASTGSANGRLETAVIGIGERGKYLIANLPDAFRVTALGDCSLDQIESIRKPPKKFAEILHPFIENQLGGCRLFQDYRQMLSEHSFDAVIIAAPDHHHALAAVLAMKSGAHVYVEKPLAVTIGEGRVIADAAARYDRVVQVGSQQRSMKINRAACEFIREGGLGRVHLVEERNLPGPMPYIREDFAAESIPEGLDWDLFCGPTPLRDYNRKLWVKDAFKFGFLRWRGWDLFEEYSGHLMTNWGAHSLDMVQFALGTDDTGPTSVELRVDDIDPFIDDQWHEKTPPLGTLRDKPTDRMRFCPLVMKYASGTRIELTPGRRKTVFHGERGNLTLSRNNYAVQPASLMPPPDPIEQERWKGAGHVARPHLQNWLNAILSRAPLKAPIEVGHRSATVCHLANLARRLGRDLRWDPKAERFVDDDAANAELNRDRRAGFELPTV